ncbi:MAG: bifunctional pyr operon transcriptional regulator/uracil phosphoribosyltransferase PyrR [Desulfohalobiaceae bacterium]
MEKKIEIMDKDQISRTLDRLTFEVLERHMHIGELNLIGIQRRGVQVAQRIKQRLDFRLGSELPLGKLDINLYRDDWTSLSAHPRINSTEVPFQVQDKDVLLVDDVLYTGRTVRAALEAILDFGRPRLVELLVLVDRGHRELPIHADYVGKKVNTAWDEQVDVLVEELDGQDMVQLHSKA